MKIVLLLICAVLQHLLLPPAAQPAGPRDLVVVQPGGPTASEEASNQVSRLIVEIARRSGWNPGSVKAFYFNRAADALAHIKEAPPGFVLTTPGFFLEQRGTLGLKPINQILINGEDTHRYYVVVRKATLTKVDDLEEAVLAGAVLAEPGFVERVVFDGRFDFSTGPKVEFRRALSALRKLSREELDAVILNEMEYAGVELLPFAGELTTLFTSDPIPNTGIFALEGVATDADAVALAGATADFCGQSEGAAICETYGITGFRRVSPDLFEPLIRRFDRPTKGPTKNN